MMRRVRRLLPIVGLRPFGTFGGVSFLVAGLLAAVHLTARYALKRYADDQLRRIHWDAAIYQKGPVGRSLAPLADAVGRVDGVARVERLAFLRAEFPPGGEVATLVDGQVLTTPWVSLMAASDAAILPPQFSLALAGAATDSGRRGSAPAARGGGSDGSARAAAADGMDGVGAVLAFVGPERAIGRSFLALQRARAFQVTVRVGTAPRVLFETPIRKVIRIDRDELNRWVLDQTGSVTYVPHIGVIVLMPFRLDVLERFDAVAAGLVPQDLLDPRDREFGHVQRAEYEPEVGYLVRFERERLISGWDLGGSLARVADANRRILEAARAAVAPPPRAGAEGPTPHELRGAVILAAFPGTSSRDAAGRRVRVLLARHPVDEDERLLPSKLVLDSTTAVLLARMERLARLVGVVTLLVALPLVWVAWLLAATLTRLLMLNERRTLGLLRLRGVPGRALGRTLTVAVVAGGTAGGALGLVAGTLGPLALYERGALPLAVVARPDVVAGHLLLLAVSVGLAWVVSRRLVRYAVSLSPVEAAGRVAASEPVQAQVRFGWPQGAALAGGALVLASWVTGSRVGPAMGPGTGALVVRLIDLAGLPLFLYGVATLVASRRRWLDRSVAPVARMTGGALGSVALGHLGAKPHRSLAFLLVMALMASVSLYPSIAGDSFADKARRGARVQTGADWQVLFHAPDLVDATRLQGSVRDQVAALRPALDDLVARIERLAGMRRATYLIEALLPQFYMPEYGMRGVPAYLVSDLPAYRATVYAEPTLGLTHPFDALLERLEAGEVAVSPPVALFKRLASGRPLRLGVDEARRGVVVRTAGVLAFLPGLPPRTVTDRQGYVQARVDYLNHLASGNAYVVAAADNPRLAGLRVLVPRVILLVAAEEGAARAALEPRLLAALPVPPLEVHRVDEEERKVASDMFVSLALANLRIYLLGGLALALIAIVAVAGANYVEDRRTLALLRLRGATPFGLWRFVLALLLAPTVAGLGVGAAVALVAGYGMADHVWELREIKTVVQLLPTRLVVSAWWAGTAALLGTLVVAVVSLCSAWVYRRTAHETLQGV